MDIKEKHKKRLKRKKSVRVKISGTKVRPRMSVFKSSRHLFVQLIDDEAKKTLFGISSKKVDEKGKSKTEVAGFLGKEIAKKAKSKKIKSVVFDRSGFRYHGRIKALAESARKEGLKI